MPEQLFGLRHKDHFGKMADLLDETGKPARMTAGALASAKRAMLTMNRLYAQGSTGNVPHTPKHKTSPGAS